jgi:hypothetical protein
MKPNASLLFETTILGLAHYLSCVWEHNKLFSYHFRPNTKDRTNFRNMVVLTNSDDRQSLKQQAYATAWISQAFVPHEDSFRGMYRDRPYFLF